MTPIDYLRADCLRLILAIAGDGTLDPVRLESLRLAIVALQAARDANTREDATT